MDTYHVVLYIHFMALFVGIGAGAVLLVCLFQLRAAQTLADAVPWGVVSGKTARAFPIAILGLFGSGAYMTSDLWSWSTGSRSRSSPSARLTSEKAARTLPASFPSMRSGFNE